MQSPVSSTFKLGILGGGQLGKMLLHPASRLDIHVEVMDPSADAPCARIAPGFTQGDLMDYESVLAFGRKVDVLTIEIEHVNVDALFQLEREGIKVYPTPASLQIIQSKVRQKQFYVRENIPTSHAIFFSHPSEIQTASLTFPCVYKTDTLGYDGKGVQILHSHADLAALPPVPGLIEEMVTNMTELSVMVARNAGGEVKAFPAVAMEFHPTANLVEFLYSPSGMNASIEQNAAALAIEVAEKLGTVGLLAVEMFVAADGRILVNESAPRPHNSGHQTIEANFTSQYEQHLRAILNLPLGSPALRCAAVMVNLLGEADASGPVRYEGLDAVLKLEGVYVHIYGKKEVKPFRKMGHVTILGSDLKLAREKAIFVKQQLKATI
jgi:5-(carboxyamino)imidazole ribonucleotide synthase